ncbi:MAG TPA: prepilin-type N-terminal cleavage/methylation domain-containing protein [Candidatus Acidoferrum sp.]|jgi:prepilin-type N-terminal cleavage/methylation domain-containing protein
MERRRKAVGQRGFTMIEALISIAVLSFGVLSLAAVYAQGLYYASLTQYDYIAEKKAEQAVEAIFTARDNNTLSWAQIQNTGSGGVFLPGAQPMLQPGIDGLVGTVSDAGSADEFIVIGPNTAGQIGTSTDQSVDLNPWMTRTIEVIPVVDTAGNNEPNLRQITVTINYHVGQMQRTHTLISYISSFA